MPHSPSDRSALRGAVEFFERFLPQKSRTEREHVYRNILADLGKKRANVLTEVLAAVLRWRFHDLGDRGAKKARYPHPNETARAFTKKEARTWYDHERKALARHLEKLHAHPLVQNFPLESVKIYAFGDAWCPHGRTRKQCENLGADFEKFRQVAPLLCLEATGALGIIGPAPRPLHARFFGKPAKSWLQNLRAHGIEPSTATSDQFCAPRDNADSRMAHDLLPVGSRVTRAQGRPADKSTAELVRVAIGALTGAGVTVNRSCDYLRALLAVCCEHHVEASALQRRWYLEKKRRTGGSERSVKG
jgi:hypothetical protein